MTAVKGRIQRGAKALAVVILLATASVIMSFPQPEAVGLFEGHQDIGEPARSGGLKYDPERQAYTVEASGANMWFDHDEFHFVWKRMRGDFILTARAEFIGKGVEQHRKMGWIARTSLDGNSAHASAVVHGDGLTSLQFRRATGAQTQEVRSSIKAPDLIQLERKGTTYIMSVARFGEPFLAEQVSDLSLGDDVYVGLFACSHNKDVVEKVVFRDVRITTPAKDNFVPYRDYIGSNIEILDIETGDRRVVYTSLDSLQAPNWTRDGKALIYNSKGRLYRFDLARGAPTAIDTDFAVNNNNDHVLSFDGKMLGISHQPREDGNRSIVYTVPIGGGRPIRITAQGPSYMHGWSPDGKFLVFTGGRDGEFDIYKIAAGGGQEIRLTTAKGLDDGPEYAPDGKHIYFCSTRTGSMQIWRMNPDGSSQEQVTSDEYNNWFPHISPNGKWIVFLTFCKDVRPDDHPFYRRVYLRLMPVEGGAARVIAYVYGGQGTINVPSWSPDSKRIAFVSNTDMK
jgi:tricorn protease-like protein